MTERSDPLIRLEGVSRTFREGLQEHRVFIDASMTVERGEFVVLVGKAGSGKTTLLQLIGGIEIPDCGTVTVAGKSLGEISDRERTLFRRRHVGIIFQGFNLIPTLNVRENVELRLELNQRRNAANCAHALALLERVGLADRGESRPDVLSGGEQQRVAIAAALVHDPDLILADEPTGQLDATRGSEIVELIESMVRESGKTLIMATHSREMVGLADRLVRIEDGQLLSAHSNTSLNDSSP